MAAKEFFASGALSVLDEAYWDLRTESASHSSQSLVMLNQMMIAMACLGVVNGDDKHGDGDMEAIWINFM